MDDFISHQCGLTGISGGTSDMRELIARRRRTRRHATPSTRFVTERRNGWARTPQCWADWIRWYFRAASENIRRKCAPAICEGLEYLGLRLDPGSNARNADVISSAESRVTVRVIPTDEEKMMAQIVSGMRDNKVKHTS